MQRGLETLVVFERFCRANGLGADDVHVIATSAIRDAANGEEFLAAGPPGERLRDRGPVGDRRGLLRLRRRGQHARRSTTASCSTSAAAACSLSHVADRHALELVSYPLGALRLTERFLPDGPTSRRARRTSAAARARSRHAQRGGLAAGRGGRLVAVGGAVRNLASAAQRADLRADRRDRHRRAGLRDHADGLRRARGDARGAAAAERRHMSPGSSRDGATSSSPPRSRCRRCSSSGASTASRRPRRACATACSSARTLLDETDPLFPDVREAAVRNLAIQYESDMAHTEHVAKLSLQMHDSMVRASLFRPKPGERELLWAAAMLHDVGMTISYDDHHRHSRYLIISAELPGLRSARAGADRPDHPLSPQGHAEARRMGRGRRARRRRAARPLRGHPAARRAP